MNSSLQWRFDNGFVGKSSFDAGKQCFASNFKTLSPLSNSHSLAIALKKVIGRLIVLLSLNGQPAAVTRRVISIVVDAIQRHVFGALSHVSVKVFEFLPSFANFDAAPAVMTKEAAFGIGCASRHHGSPSSMAWRLIHAMRGRQFGISGGRKFASKAPAGSGEAAPKLCASNKAELPAIAQAVPSRTALNRISRKNEKASELDSGQINCVRHVF